MTIERIAEGLWLLVQRLGSADLTVDGQAITAPPEGWQAHEWAYVKGLGAGAIMQLRAQIVPRGTSQTSVSDIGKSQT